MPPLCRFLIAIAGIYGSAGVALAAWASHRAGGESLMTAAYFLLLHAGPILAVGLAPARRRMLAGALILALGAALFSGDLALRGMAGLKPWPMAAPAGGLLLIFGWLWLAVAACLPGGQYGPGKSA
jgi:uncharacterized membrane protein YgdD (TMEM256/DUF423 family)